MEFPYPEKGQITIYSKSGCINCTKVKTLLKDKSIVFNIIDCDEFIVLKKHKTIKQFLTDFDNPYGVGLNWFFYGSNGKLKRDNNSLLKQFTKRQVSQTKHTC